MERIKKTKQECNKLYVTKVIFESSVLKFLIFAIIEAPITLSPQTRPLGLHGLVAI